MFKNKSVKRPLFQAGLPGYLFTTVFTVLVFTLSGCGASIDSQESAEAHIKNLVENSVQPTYQENQVRANIQLTKTNLLAMLPDLDEYPLSMNAGDDARTEVVEIFTSSEKAGQGRDGFYLEMAQQLKTVNRPKSSFVKLPRVWGHSL